MLQLRPFKAVISFAGEVQIYLIWMEMCWSPWRILTNRMVLGTRPHRSRLRRIKCKNENQVMTFTLSNIKFLGKKRRKLPLKVAIDNTKSIMQVEVHYHWQKNDEHGEKEIMNRNKKKPKIYPVEAWIRIVQHFLQLQKLEPQNLPLSIYYDPYSNSIKNITNFLVTEVMRKLAKEFYDIDAEELKSFSCHSLWVGACCALYSHGVPKKEIKQIIHWKSDSWQDYLRDLSYIAEQQITTMCKANKIPN